MQTDYSIRPIDARDIPSCVRVIRASFMTVAEALGLTPENAPRFTAFATTADRLRHQIEHEQRLMAACCAGDGAIIGYYSLLRKDDGACELNNLCVLPEYRHRRIGDALLRDAFARAALMGCRRMDIGIVEENRTLRRWYEAKGFVHTGTRKFDFFPFTCGYMTRALDRSDVARGGR